MQHSNVTHTHVQRWNRFEFPNQIRKYWCDFFIWYRFFICKKKMKTGWIRRLAMQRVKKCFIGMLKTNTFMTFFFQKKNKIQQKFLYCVYVIKKTYQWKRKSNDIHCTCGEFLSHQFQCVFFFVLIYSKQNIYYCIVFFFKLLLFSLFSTVWPREVIYNWHSS